MNCKAFFFSSNNTEDERDEKNNVPSWKRRRKRVLFRSRAVRAKKSGSRTRKKCKKARNAVENCWWMSQTCCANYTPHLQVVIAGTRGPFIVILCTATYIIFLQGFANKSHVYIRCLEMFWNENVNRIWKKRGSKQKIKCETIHLHIKRLDYCICGETYLKKNTF